MEYVYVNRCRRRIRLILATAAAAKGSIENVTIIGNVIRHTVTQSVYRSYQPVVFMQSIQSMQCLNRYVVAVSTAGMG